MSQSDAGLDHPRHPAAPWTRRDTAALLAVVLAFAAVRVAVFPFAENLYGDAIARVELVERWLEHPHLIRSFDDGARQYGPLHLYLMGLALKLWPSREHAPRLVSLLFGVLMALPLYRLGRRLFGRPAAVAAGLATSVWCLHVQASTTSASEAIFLTLFFFALDFLFQGLEERGLRSLFVSALFANLACAMRYDAWLYLPLFAATVALTGSDRIASTTRAILYGVATLIFPASWMNGNEKATGDPFYPVHFIDAFHRQWVEDEVRWLGRWGFRAESLLFWPGSLLVTASLLVGLFALVGLARSFAARKNRALALFAVLPSLYFTVRAAALMSFVPIARFTMPQLALALLFVKDGFDLFCGRLPRTARGAVAILAGAIAVATPAWIGQFTAWREGWQAETLRPISPLSTAPVELVAAARFLKARARDSDGVIVDEEPGYRELPVAFYSGLAERRLARRRWENFEAQLGTMSAAPWLVAFKGGALATRDGLTAGEPSLAFRGRRFRLAASFGRELFVYRAGTD